jgi:hypothetical protein
MRKYFSLLFGVLTASYGVGQYCTAVGPSSTADSNVESVLLSGVSGSINYTGCPGVIGLQDLTSQQTTLNAGSNYSISVQFGTCGGNYSGAGSVWIDFNLDGNFEPSELIGSWSGTPPVALSVFSFNVPAGSQNGSTRMRVTQQEAASLPLNPCDNFSWGSVMDFSIVIQNGIDCSGYPGDDKTDAILITAFPFTDTRDNSFCYTNQNFVYASADIYYKLIPNPNLAQVTASLCGSTFDTFISVIDTAGNVIAYNDDYSGCGSSSQVTFSPINLGPLYIIVEGWGTEIGVFTLNLTSSNLGVPENLESSIQLIPNPASEYFRIIGYSGKIEIVDLSGKIVKSLFYSEHEKIDLTDLSLGAYSVSFIVNDIPVVKKLILSK